MKVQIDRAGLPHAAAICELVRELAGSFHEQSPVTLDTVGRFLAAPGSGIFVALDEGHLVGLLSFTARPSLFHAGTAGLIEDFVVTAGHRNRGIGGLLLDAFLSEGKKQGWVEVSVSTEKDNTGALSFYAKHGFNEQYVFLERHL